MPGWFSRRRLLIGSVNGSAVTERTLLTPIRHARQIKVKILHYC
jgi:hypothetical protein